MTNPNDPASPVIFTEKDYCRNSEEYFDNTQSIGGLTKRELFAAMAMQGLCANPYLSERGVHHEVGGDDYRARLSTEAIKQTDALIAALNQGAE